MQPVITKKELSIGMALVKNRNNKPSQLVIGPGMIGKKLPAIPKIEKNKPRKINKVSIAKILYTVSLYR